jgi:transposase InsO family protein
MQNNLPLWERWARFRFSVIGGLLASPPGPGELTEQLRQLAERIYQHPLHPGKPLILGLSTIERWYYQARAADDPIAVLAKKVRSDSGCNRALSPELTAELERQYRRHPRWSVQLHCDNLTAVAAERPELGAVPSYQTIRRRMRENGWDRLRVPADPTDGQRRAADRLAGLEVRSFEVAHVHALWHLDFHHTRLKVVDRSGRWRTPMALAILDDHSRLCCHLQFYLEETAENLIHGLIQAFLKRGLPRALLTDNGSAMLAEETREGLARLGVEHKTTLPYSPYQNGKQEVFWAQLEGRLVEMLRGTGSLTLTFLNRAGQAWVEQDYHRREHREIGATPLQRLLNGSTVDRQPPAIKDMQLAFSRKVTRNQRKSDNTVSVDGIRFEVPARFRHLPRLALRYQGWDKSCIHLVDPNTGGPLAQLLPIDKVRNASGHRRQLAPPATPPARTAEPEIPALLRRWLADYAATGLPPAYLPKDEIEEDSNHA